MPRVSKFKHDNNVWACAGSALILLPVVNLSPVMDSATLIKYVNWKVLAVDPSPTLLFVYFGDLPLRMRSFDHITTSGLKSDIIIEFTTPVII